MFTEESRIVNTQKHITFIRQTEEQSGMFHNRFIEKFKMYADSTEDFSTKGIRY